ncbi:MAG: signal peptidase II [Acidiferrobacterales bacterium]|nr:signal peptidase II [Acidiferrobacterales bacterium]
MSDTRLQFSERKTLGIHLGLALTVLVADQITKVLVLTNAEPFRPIPVTDFFNIYLVFNKGAAFGFLADSDIDANTLFLFVTVGILALLLYVLWVSRPGRSQAVTGIWLIIGGAAGNLADRIAHGHVVDFLDFYYANWHYSTFNLADACITAGAVLIALEIFGLRILFRRS